MLIHGVNVSFLDTISPFAILAVHLIFNHLSFYTDGCYWCNLSNEFESAVSSVSVRNFLNWSQRKRLKAPSDLGGRDKVVDYFPSARFAYI